MFPVSHRCVEQRGKTYTAATTDLGDVVRRQRALLVGRACDEFLASQDAMGMTEDRIPRFAELNERLRAATGWSSSASRACCRS
jgi:phenylalanine-4-hydroxylase